MFFDSLDDFPRLARNTNFSIFAVDPKQAKPLLEKTFKSSVLFLEPDEKSGKISVEAVREFTALSETRETHDRFFAVLSAETLTPAAQNAFLKNLEEPKPLHHFLLLTQSPSALLPTVLSRAQVFYLKLEDPLSAPVAADEKVRALAKQLIVADTKTLLTLSADIAKKKDNARAYALAVTGTAIELLYKSYFATSSKKLLSRLPAFLKLYEALEKNGHIRLQIVANLL